MTRRKLLRILIPLLGALVVTFLIAKLTAQPKAATASVVVATQDVSAGAILSSQDLSLKSVPAGSALPGSVTSVPAAAGEVTRVGLAVGDPVLSNELQASQMAGLSYQIPAGERAFTVPVNGVSGVAGNLAPGDEVDVLATFPAQSTGTTAQAHADVVVQGVAILGLGTGTGSVTPAAGNNSPYTLVTLAVTPTQAATISLSEQVGSVTFLLRPHAHPGTGTASVTVGGLP